MLITTSSARDPLPTVVGRHATVIICSSAPELLAELALGDVQFLVMEPVKIGDWPLSRILHAVRARHPNLPIVAYCSLTRDHIRGVITMCDAGVRDIIIRGHDDGADVWQRMSSHALRSSDRSRIRVALDDVLTRDQALYVNACLCHVQWRSGDRRVSCRGGPARRRIVDHDCKDVLRCRWVCSAIREAISARRAD